MKKWVLVNLIVLLVSMGACDNPAKQVNVSKARADSLEDEVLKGHDIAMPKSMKIPDLQAEIKRMMDSIDKLPSKAKEAAAPYKADLESLNTELAQAYTSMESWMEAFGTRMQELDSDSLKNNFEEKIKYYSGELPKIDKIKAAVLESVHKAESFLKAKSSKE